MESVGKSFSHLVEGANGISSKLIFGQKNSS